MANQVIIPSSSAVSNSVKFNTYREEAKRVLRNTSSNLPWTDKADLLSKLSLRMKKSGYSETFRSKIISEGLRGHMKKMISSHQNGTPFNRSGQSIREANVRRKRGGRRTGSKKMEIQQRLTLCYLYLLRADQS